MKALSTALATLALACGALAGCDGGGPTAPAGPKAPHNVCEVNRIRTTCGPVPHVPGDTVTPPTTPPAASFKYYQIHAFYYNGSGIKTAEVGAESDSYANVAYTLADAYITGANCATNVDIQTWHRIASGYGSPYYAAAGFQFVYPGNSTYIKWKINSTHTFSPVAGATGGGTFTLSWAGCF
jgi:hypothetical protein